MSLLDPVRIEQTRLLYRIPRVPSRGRAIQLVADGAPAFLEGNWNGDFAVAEYEKELAFSSGSFDVVILHGTLDRLWARARRDGHTFVPAEFLAKVFRILSDGGLVIGCAGNRHGFGRILRAAKRVIARDAGSTGAIDETSYPLSAVSCRKTLAAAGFQEIRTFSMVPDLDSANRLIGIGRGWSRQVCRWHAQGFRSTVGPAGYLAWRILSELGISQYLGPATFFWGRKRC